MSFDVSKKYLTRSQVAMRYGVVPRSVMRWEKDISLAFPAGFTVNGRWLFDEADLVQWERARATAEKRAA